MSLKNFLKGYLNVVGSVFLHYHEISVIDKINGEVVRRYRNFDEYSAAAANYPAHLYAVV